MEAKGIEHRPSSIDENPFIWTLSKAGVPRILVESFLACVRFCADMIPKRISLGCLRILAALLVIVVPRSLTYLLLYPIFRLVFGNLYPAYASYKAVRTKNVKEYVKWMMYWIVFALFTCAETFTDVFFSFWFPFYYEIKTILVVWLLSPATKGSSILYRRFVHPALIRREAEIDEALARATEQGYTAVLHLGSKGVNYATTVLMQTAIKHLKSDLDVAREIPASKSDSAISSLAKCPASPTLQTGRDQEDSATTSRWAQSSSSVNYEELMAVESVSDMHEDTEMNTDTETELVRDTEPTIFKVPQPKRTAKSRRARRFKAGTTRRLRYTSREDFDYCKYSDDDCDTRHSSHPC